MQNNYNHIAKVYDQISRLVFGRALVNAQVFLLQAIPSNSRVLIVGGGTGWVLEELVKVHASGLHVTYVELSAGMIALAKKRNCGSNEVVFVEQGIEDYTTPSPFNVIFTAFLFDNFRQDKANNILRRLNGMLSPAGSWLFADFHYNRQTGKRWQKLLLQSMILFFRIVSHIEATSLPDMAPLYKELGYEVTRSTFRFKGFIQAKVYRRLL